MNKDIVACAKTRFHCQHLKVMRYNRLVPKKLPISDTRFNVRLDLIGPLPSSRGFRYCLTLIDRFPRWFEVVLLLDIGGHCHKIFLHDMEILFCFAKGHHNRLRNTV